MQTQEVDRYAVYYKTGQRVPETGNYRDQYGIVSYHVVHRTFPPCIGRKGECAMRVLAS